ncbi:SDR family NAD(P)-dependent oxidoreductase [Martelella sp. HB161492]|uniref:SDR family NAD(P)-dependent oxidoreductase n=1 Tax=Martelella sp. HB161492 TaxID=2720726 RepID=UPI0015917A9C|nr:SDR family NAD(P)-dependent oxidoreductase [Martelella sp. HB161492]
MPAPSLISTPFTAESTAAEVMSGISLQGIRAIVTGASSGLGIETARSLAVAGAEVVLAVRNLDVGRKVAKDIQRETKAAAPGVAYLDLADRSSIAAFVESWDAPLHLLINNAGVVTGGLERTPEGWELQFATNHLGHFALATGLHRALARGAAERNGARIVALSSTAHMRAGIDFDDLHFERRPYDPQIAYAQSKTANALFAVEATRLWASDGIVANAVNPGGVVTGLQRNFTAQQRASLDAAAAAGVFRYKTVEQGAATTMVAAALPEFAHTGGHYLDDCREAYTVGNEASLADHPHGVKEWALDPLIARRLWTVSSELLLD